MSVSFLYQRSLVCFGAWRVCSLCIACCISCVRGIFARVSIKSAASSPLLVFSFFFLLVLDGSVFLYRFLCCLFPSSCCVVPVGRVTMITMSTPLSTKYNKEMIGRVSMLFFQLHSEPMSASASSPVVVCLALCLFECFELFDFVWICLSQFCFISRYLRLLGGCPS